MYLINISSIDKGLIIIIQVLPILLIETVYHDTVLIDFFVAVIQKTLEQKPIEKPFLVSRENLNNRNNLLLSLL